MVISTVQTVRMRFSVGWITLYARTPQTSSVKTPDTAFLPPGSVTENPIVSTIQMRLTPIVSTEVSVCRVLPLLITWQSS